MAKSAGKRAGRASSGRSGRSAEKYVGDKLAARAKAARGAGPAMRKLMALSLDDEQNMTASLDGYRKLSAMRRAAWREHFRKMKVTPELQAEIDALAEKFGKTAKVWHNVVEWPIALLVARYGEAPEHWPSEFSDVDLRRAREMAAGTGTPLQGVTPLTDDNVAQIRERGLLMLSDSDTERA